MAENAALEFVKAALLSAAGPEDFVRALLDSGHRRLLRRLAVPRRFDPALLEQILRPDAGVSSEEVPSAEILSRPPVRALSGRPGWYRVEAREREVYERSWDEPEVATRLTGESADPERYRRLNQDVASWFEVQGPDGALEALYHGIVADLSRSKAPLLAHFRDALDRFDLARCENLLDLLDQRARFLDSELASFRTNARGLLHACRAVADDYYRTGRYLERERLRTAFESVLQDSKRFILHLHGGGGRGKTMFLRWLAARYCLPRRIPIARIDFDFLDESESGLAPRFLFGKLAQRLSPQLDGSPFDELVGTVHEMRRAALAGKSRQRKGAGTSARDELEVVERFGTLLEEHCRGPVVLVFDTLEDARLKHGIDVLAVVKAIASVRRVLTSRAKQSSRPPPHLVLILSGRYTLAQQHPDVNEAFQAAMLTTEVTAFDPVESHAYLTRNRGLPDTPLLNAVVKRAGGVPFKLALYADVLQAQPNITQAELESYPDVDLLHLIKRVLLRIPDFQMRWVLRYGSVARRLTLPFLKDVLAPHLERAMRRRSRGDDPAEDDVPKGIGWPALWYDKERRSREGRPDYDQLWKRMWDYASASSWVKSDESIAGTLVIEPVVTHPMRRALRDKRVVRLIHQDAARKLRRELKGYLPEPAERLAALTYHEFQLNPARAARTWQRRLEQYEDESLEALAQIVLSEDLKESEAVVGSGAGRSLVTPPIEARAHFGLATAAYQRAEEAESTEEELRFQDEARLQLDEFSALQANLGTRIVPLVMEASLRAELASSPEARQLAIQQLTEAERTRLPFGRRVALLTALERAYQPVDLELAETYALKSARLALRHRDLTSFTVAMQAVVNYRASRGALVSALSECRTAGTTLTSRKWDWSWASRTELTREREELLNLRLELEGRCGLVSVALDHRLPGASEGLIRTRARRLLVRAGLALRADAPALAIEIASSASSISSQVASRRRSAGPHRISVHQIEATLMEGIAYRRLMSFGKSLDLQHAAINLAAKRDQHDLEVYVRLEKARTYLHHIGDLRQAAEHLGDHDDALIGESVELRLEHTLLRALLHDRRGDQAEVERLLSLATGLLEDLPRGVMRHRLNHVLSALSCGTLKNRLPYLERLRDVLAAIDHAAPRLTMLRALRYCDPLPHVPPELASQLERLTAPAALDVPGYRGLSQTDRLRLTVARTEVLRVIGRATQAVAELRRAVIALRMTTSPMIHRDVALACDRLGIDPDQVLPTGWLTRLCGEFKQFPTFCGAALLEHGEREFRRGSAARASRLARESFKLLTSRGEVPSRYRVRVLLLLAGIAREGGAEEQARRHEILADRVGSELGSPARTRETELLVEARRAAWAEQLAASEVLGVRIESPEALALLSWHRTRAGFVATPRAIHLPLRDILGQLEQGALSGSASLSLIEQLRGDWVRLGVLLADGVLPLSLRKAVAWRLRGQARGSAGLGGELEIALSCDRLVHHAIPWELAVLDRKDVRPLVFMRGLRFFWRSRPDAMSHGRLAWAQHALRRLTDSRLLADGVLGPATAEALRQFQSTHSLEPTGALDTATRDALRDAFRKTQRSPSREAAVLLVRTEERYEVRGLRGHMASGTDLDALYKRARFEVVSLHEPDPTRLRDLLIERRFAAVILAVPVAESRSGRELYLQLGLDSLQRGESTAFSSGHLASVLKSIADTGPMPLIILDTPRPPSLDEAFRQLLLRNALAARLFALGGLPAVLATGLATPDEQSALSSELARGLFERETPGRLASRLREMNGWGSGRIPSRPEAILGAATVALFAGEPDLTPEDQSVATSRDGG